MRLYLAGSLYLNPDEVMRVLAADKDSLAAVFRADLDNPHPPLLSFLLFFWQLLGRSDFTLRLLPVLCGLATVWFGHRWVRNAFGEQAGRVGLLLLAFSPSMVVLGYEVRPYAPELAAIAVGLWALERGLRESKPRFLLLFGAAQSVAVCSHYSSLLFVFAAGAFVLAKGISRMRRGRWQETERERDQEAEREPRTGIRGAGRIPRRLVLAWLAGELLTAAVLVLLYFVHISRLVGGQRETILKEEYLRSLYFSPERGGLPSFLVSRTVDLFRYIAADRGLVLAVVFLTAFVVGLVVLVRRRRGGDALLLGLPFAAAAAAAALGLYPLGGTRHLSFLILFATAGVSVAVARVASGEWRMPGAGRDRAGRGRVPLAVGIALVPLWWLFGGWMIMGGYLNPLVAKRGNIEAAVAYVRGITPPGGTVFSDLQTQLLLKRYLWTGGRRVEAAYPEGFFEYRRPGGVGAERHGAGYRLVGLRDWRFVVPRFGDDFTLLTETYGLAPGTPVTVVSTEWFYPHLAAELRSRGIEYPATRAFGPRISVFTVRAGEQVVGESTAAVTVRTASRLDSMLREVSRQRPAPRPGAPRRYRTAFWPGRFVDSGTRQRLQGLADRVMSHAELAESLSSDQDADVSFLPAIAFWVYGSREMLAQRLRFDPDTLARMKDDVRSTRIASDPAGAIGVYEMDAPAGDVLAWMMRMALASPVGRVRTILWPGRYLWLARELPVGELASQAVPYRVLQRAEQRGELQFDALLPALAFWQFMTGEAHPEFMSCLSDFRDHESGGYRFTLLGMDPGRMIGLYLVGPARPRQ